MNSMYQNISLNMQEYCFIKAIKQCEMWKQEATPQKLMLELGCCYETTHKIGKRLVDKGLIHKINDNWRVRYEIRKET